jgi:sigma-B regulation protein RsbU (phosphoserine phosphatase)
VYDAVNRVLCTLHRDRLGSDKFMTQNYFRSSGDTIEHVGTHLVGLLWRARNEDVEELTGLVDQTGFLGLSEFVVSTQSLGSFAMHAGDVLLLYSDGVTEAKNGRGDEFGLDGLKRALFQHADGTPQELIAAVTDDLRRHAAGGDLKKHGRFADDVSLVVLKKL